MRLDRLDLTRYGHFTDRRIDFRPASDGGPDLHIVYGANEAGKSTLFSAWLDLLFGIPLRSRNDFLHPANTMQIGALLSDGPRTAEFRRLKRNTGSLIDAHDAMLPETVLQSYLGGLSREGYSAMFSLDDETLEKGGDSILASRGDLGEMLFAASAGLSDLAPQLETIRAELDAVYRIGGRKGALHDARKQLQDMDRARKDLEVTASAIQKLVRDAEGCEATWRLSRQQEADLAKRLDLLRQQDAALPLHRKLAAHLTAMQDLDHLPDATPADLERFDRLDRDHAKIADRRADRTIRVQALVAERDALSPDPAVLALAPRIAQVEALRAAHDTALQDLPRRLDEVRSIEADLRATLAQLGHDGDAADVILSAARTAQLRALLEARSGVIEASHRAIKETQDASDRLGRETEQSDDPGPIEDDGPLDAFLARMQAQDPVDARDKALRDRDVAQSRLKTAIDRLAPWVGDADTLAGLVVPTSWQITAWGENGESLRQRLLDLNRAAQDLRDGLSDGPAPDAAVTGGFTLADASAARSKREALWAEHRDTLTPLGAQAFEQAMRDDDRISAVLAEVMAAVRLEDAQAADREARKARLAATMDDLEQAVAEQSALNAAMNAVCDALGLRDAALPDLRRWLDLRVLALTERAALREAVDTLARAERGLARSAETLRTLLSEGDATLGFDTLLARARARQTSMQDRRATRRLLANAKTHLRERTQAAADAAANLSVWQTEWAAACGDGLMSRHAWNAAGLGKMLDLLDRLAQDVIARDGFADRIAKMQANRDHFTTARDAVLTVIGSPHLPWDSVLSRLRQAEDCVKGTDRLSRDLAKETREDDDDQRQLTSIADDLTALEDVSGCPEGGDLAAHLNACLRAHALRVEIAELRRDLLDRPASDAAPGDLARDIQSTADDLHLARDETERCHALHLEARRALQAVGGDDAVARLVERRENLALEMREQARDHLSARFGLMAFEAALRRYRDHHRSSMLTRASAAFATLSHNAYSGLASQPDGQQDVLVALAASGGAKMAVDMSKGTRFQLYLALRIAGYHELAASRPTVPFIADDIMETFDDDRSAAAFSLLSQMSGVGQVIYLTHHRHLCDIAKDVCPGVNIIDL